MISVTSAVPRYRPFSPWATSNGPPPSGLKLSVRILKPANVASGSGSLSRLFQLCGPWHAFPLYCVSRALEMVHPIRNWHQIAAELLLSDADIALLSIAKILGEDDKDELQRVVRETRDAYESIQAKRKGVRMTEAQRAALDEKMDRLRARLRFIGERV